MTKESFYRDMGDILVEHEEVLDLQLPDKDHDGCVTSNSVAGSWE